MARPKHYGGYPAHPATAKYPLMSPEDLFDLAMDIRKNGLTTPVVLRNRQVLDGRNRLLACEMAGIDPRFVECDLDEGSIEAYLASTQETPWTPPLAPYKAPPTPEATAIRAVAKDERVGSIIEAARILPLVGWDVELAIEYYMEEIAREIEADDARSKARKAARGAQ